MVKPRYSQQEKQSAFVKAIYPTHSRGEVRNLFLNLIRIHTSGIA
jgi:hypothetical protein